MPDILRHAEASWEGDLRSGIGKASTGSGALKEADVTFSSRFEDAAGSNPEELLAAAHASCFSMQLSGLLTAQGTPPGEIRTKATLTLRKDESGARITRMHLVTEGRVAGIEEAAFKAAAEKAKEICPVSALLTPGLEAVTLDARLVA